MLLYFSSDKNKDIFNKIDEDVKIENTNYFSEYINKNLNSLTHIDFLALDLEHLADDETEIINALYSFRSFNKQVDVIIVALGRTKGDIFLGKLFSEGIYNFVTSENQADREKEVINCINKKNNYSTASGYRIEDFKIQNTIKTEKKNFFTGFVNIFENMKKSKKEQTLKKEKNKIEKENNNFLTETKADDSYNFEEELDKNKEEKMIEAEEKIKKQR